MSEEMEIYYKDWEKIIGKGVSLFIDQEVKKAIGKKDFSISYDECKNRIRATIDSIITKEIFKEEVSIYFSSKLEEKHTE